MVAVFDLSLNIQAVLVGVIVGLVLLYVIPRLKYKLPPGPCPLPIIGNYKVMKVKFMHTLFEEYSKKYGPVFKVYLGPVMVVVLNDINVVKEALLYKKADFANRPKMASTNVVSEGYKDIGFANYTPILKTQRYIAGKALRNYMAGDNLEHIIHESVRHCLDKMAKEKVAFDPVPYIDLIVFSILDKIVFGESADFNTPGFKRYTKLLKEADELFGNGLIEDLFPIVLKIRPTKTFRTFSAIMEEILDIFRRKFKEHCDTFDPDNIRDLTDALILARNEMTNDDDEHSSDITDTHLIQIIADVINAGNDTSRLTLYFAFRYMAGLPDIQNKVQEELDRVVGKNRLPILKDRVNLNYGEATLHEVMRLGTVLPFGLPHSTRCDTQVGGFDIPKDTTIMVNYWALHHDPNHWENVETFDPSRYLDENGKLCRKPESWLPFSMGRRVCLAETVAKAELHLIFSMIFQRFTIKLDAGLNADIKIEGTPTRALQPAPFKIVVQERI